MRAPTSRHTKDATLRVKVCIHEKRNTTDSTWSLHSLKLGSLPKTHFERVVETPGRLFCCVGFSKPCSDIPGTSRDPNCMEIGWDATGRRKGRNGTLES